MIPVMCRVKDDPENKSYGDCVRACVASILEMDGDTVPHFFHDNCDGTTGNKRICNFLKPLGYAPFMINYDGNIPRDDLMEMMTVLNRDTYYVLFGMTDTGDHAVVYRGGKQAHNPSWVGSPIVRAGSHGMWSVLVIAKS